MKFVGIQCLKCDDHIYSEKRNGMKWCKCKANAIDGDQGSMCVFGYLEDWKFVQLTFDGKGGVVVQDYNGPEQTE